MARKFSIMETSLYTVYCVYLIWSTLYIVLCKLISIYHRTTHSHLFILFIHLSIHSNPKKSPVYQHFYMASYFPLLYILFDLYIVNPEKHWKNQAFRYYKHINSACLSVSLYCLSRFYRSPLFFYCNSFKYYIS